MITQIKGRLVEKSPTELVIDCNGLGYLVNISLNTFSLLSDSENISLYTHLQVKEDSHTLFGFYEKTERNLFRKLISVSGIGASTAGGTGHVEPSSIIKPSVGTVDSRL